MATVHPLHPVRPSSEIREEIANLETAHRNEVEKISSLQGKRDFALVNSTDKQLDELEDSIGAHGRERDRLVVRVAALRLELQVAQERERARAEEEEIARCRKISERSRQLLSVEYPKLASRMAALLAEVTAASEYLRRHAPEGAGALDPEEVRREPVRVVKGRGEYLEPDGAAVVVTGAAMGGPHAYRNNTQEPAMVKRFEPDTNVGGELPPPLAENVALPAYGYRDQPIWLPQESVYDARARYLAILKGVGVI